MPLTGRGGSTPSRGTLTGRQARLKNLEGWLKWSPAMAGRGVAKKDDMWVYILFSSKLKKFYIGQTSDLKKRLTQHNNGLGRYTKAGIPWVLVYKEFYKSRNEALVREKLIKSYKGGQGLKKLIGGLAEWSKARGC